MLVVDTSVWVDFLGGRASPSAEQFDRALDTEEIVLGDLVQVELLQGVRKGPQLDLTEQYLQRFRKETFCGPKIAPLAAANYRKLRQSGVTIRGTIDVIIATWCIENDVPLLHNDRDFSIMESVLGLEGYRVV